MNKFKIGVMVDSFNIGIKPGIKKAAEVGAEGVQIYAVSGEMDPRNLDGAARKNLARYIKDSGLSVSALCAELELGGSGFASKDGNQWILAKTKEVMDLAADMKTNVVSAHIGSIPSDSGSVKYKIMYEALCDIAAYGEKTGVSFAIETGPEKSEVLRDFLISIPFRGIGANLDPANLMMEFQEHAAQAVQNLRGYILHTHAKDAGKRMTPSGEQYEETPLGEGEVDFTGFLNALGNIGYKGFLTIEREVGDDPEADIRKAVEFLRNLMK